VLSSSPSPSFSLLLSFPKFSSLFTHQAWAYFVFVVWIISCSVAITLFTKHPLHSFPSLSLFLKSWKEKKENRNLFAHQETL
jgi:hypothetical protein